MNLPSSPVPAELLSRVPTLTEVLAGPSSETRPEMPDLGQDALDLARPAAGISVDAAGGEAHIHALMEALAPRMSALVSSHLRELLAPALQSAVQQAVSEALEVATEAAIERVVEQFRPPMIQALQVQFRDTLEAELRRVPIP